MGLVDDAPEHPVDDDGDYQLDEYNELGKHPDDTHELTPIEETLDHALRVAGGAA